MRRFRFLFSALAGAVTVGSIALSSVPAGVAKSVVPSQEILQTAQQTTVQINGNTEERSFGGSGVLVAREGNLYAVLTNQHVVCQLNAADRCQADVAMTIRTFDGQRHPVVSVARFSNKDERNADLAIVYFRSPQAYPIATIGNSDQVAERDLLWIYGFPGHNGIHGEARKPLWSKGYMLERRSPSSKNGYELHYGSLIFGGMSGSPIFDVTGRVVGIDSATRLDGSALGIPINKLFSLGIPLQIRSSSLQVDRSPITGERPQLRSPQTAEDFYLHGVIQSYQGNHREAISLFTRALQIDSRMIPAYLGRATVRHRLGDQELAIADYDRILQLEPEDDFVLYERARIKLAKHDLPGAIADFTGVLNLNPKDPDALVGRGVAFMLSHKIALGLTDLSAATRLDPQNATALVNRGVARIGMGDLDGGFADMQSAAVMFQQQGKVEEYQTTLNAINKLRSLPLERRSQSPR